MRSFDIHRRRLGTRRDIRAGSGRDTVLGVDTGRGIGVEGLDVEDDGYNIQIKPETSAQVGSLSTIHAQSVLNHCETDQARTSFKRLSVTPAPRNLQRCSVENLRRVEMTCFSIDSD